MRSTLRVPEGFELDVINEALNGHTINFFRKNYKSINERLLMKVWAINHAIRNLLALVITLTVKIYHENGIKSIFLRSVNATV
jgi:hypothetical protein